MAKAKKDRKKVVRGSRAQEVLRETWSSTRKALGSAEHEVEKQVKTLLKKNKINVNEAAEMLKQFQARVDRERKKGVKELEHRFAQLQARVKKERHNVARYATEAVQTTLAALNIPSRKEVSELTRKVDELSKKIDRLRKK